MTVLLGSWDFIAIQRDVYFIVRVLIAVLIMFTYICGPSFILLACYIMFTMFNDDFVSNTPNISSLTNHRLRKREGERSLTLRPFTWYQGLVSSPDAETADGRNSNCPEVRVGTSKLLFNPDEILRGHPTWKSIIPSMRRSDTFTRFMLQNL